MDRVAVHGSRVGIAGGSIGGCATAIALRKAGCDVTVFERSEGLLKDRGAGIGIPVPLYAGLVADGYLTSTMPACRSRQRIWIADDGRAGEGRVIWRQPSSAVLNNWAVLWRTLRAQVPDTVYREGTAVVHVDCDADGAEVTLHGGQRERFDAIVGADGYRSTIRRLVTPGSKPVYARYVAWRGNLDEQHLGDQSAARALLEGAWLTICFPGGHVVLYLIPGFDQRADPGHRRLNWVVYSQPPAATDFADAASVPAGGVCDSHIGFLHRLVDAQLPPYWAEAVRVTTREHLSIQPIYDRAAPTYVSGRVALIGDAATVTRPHTGSGATKALQDALALEHACREHSSWDDALAAYDRERCAAGNELVELGRRLGEGQVERTPDWLAMSPADFDEWTRAMLGGHRLYHVGNVTDDADRRTVTHS